jgi:hypothetical protein
MLTVLGGLVEFECELIGARTGEGRRRAQARGVKFGQPPKLTPHQRREAIERLRAVGRRPRLREPTAWMLGRSGAWSARLAVHGLGLPGRPGPSDRATRVLAWLSLSGGIMRRRSFIAARAGSGVGGVKQNDGRGFP